MISNLPLPVRTSLASRFPAAERLEDRIAPAGLVTVSFLDGHLTINGADGADHDVEIVKTGENSFRVSGNATAINVAGKTTKSFQGELTHVRIDGGAGADSFEVSNLSPLVSLRFEGNGGADALITRNLVTTLGGRVNIALGSETGSVDFRGNETAIRGSLNLDLGGGGTATFSSALTTVDERVAITGGPGSDTVSITGDATLFRGELDFTGGAGDDSFRATGDSFMVRGAVTMIGGPDTDLFLFAADKHRFGRTLDSAVMDLKLGVGTGTVTFRGDSTEILGGLKIDLGTGGGLAQLTSTVTEVLNGVQVSGGEGNDSLEFDGRTKIGGNLAFTGGVGDDVLTARGGLFEVNGDTGMIGGSGASTFDLNVVRVALADLSVRGGTANDSVSILADGTIAGDVSLQLGLDGTGPSSTILQSRAGIANGLKFGGSLTIDMLGATVDVLTIANIQVAKGFVAQTGENVSTIDLSRLNAKGNFTLHTGSGADVVNIDNINTRNFEVNTESGADELRIERNPLYVGTSQVLGIATILTGIGADQIRIGNGSDSANLKVSFMDDMTLDAGDGANMRNDIVGSNAFASAPTIVATGGTLTQTEAI